MEEEIEKLQRENSQLRGRVDFLVSQLMIIRDNAPWVDPTTVMWCDAVIKMVNKNPIPA